MFNLTDNLVAAKFYAELDPDEDPRGLIALSKVDFRQKGLFLPEKEYTSPTHALQTLEANKARINSIFDQVKQNQVDGYKKHVGNVAKQDQAILNMPCIRINAPQTMGAHVLKKELKDNMKNNVKRVVPLQYIKGKAFDPNEAISV